MHLKTFKTQVEISYPGAVSLYLPLEIDYRVDTSQRGKPKVFSIVGFRYQINGEFKGVAELRLRQETIDHYFEEIQEQETADAEFGEGV